MSISFVQQILKFKSRLNICQSRSPINSWLLKAELAQYAQSNQ